MLIAHMPTGYIVSKALKKQPENSLILSSLLFSIWPDLDLIYFYFFDSTKTFHHRYFPHLPIVMIVVFIITLPLYNLKFFKSTRIYFRLFYIN